MRGDSSVYSAFLLNPKYENGFWSAVAMTSHVIRFGSPWGLSEGGGWQAGWLGGWAAWLAAWPGLAGRGVVNLGCFGMYRLIKYASVCSRLHFSGAVFDEVFLTRTLTKPWTC